MSDVGLNLRPDEIAAAKSREDWRTILQHKLYRQIPEACSAKFFTPFFLHSPEERRDLWLIHLCGASKAKDVMLGLHWDEHTSFRHFGRPGTGMLGYDKAEDALRLPLYGFDNPARQLSVSTLQDELPSIIHGYDGGISFEQLFAEVTNDSPVKSDILKESIAEMHRNHECEVLSADKRTRRQCGIQHKSDLIRLPRQKRLVFSM